MLKRSMIIIIAATLLCSVTACSGSGSGETVTNSETSKLSVNIDDLKKELENGSESAELSLKENENSVEAESNSDALKQTEASSEESSNSTADVSKNDSSAEDSTSDNKKSTSQGLNSASQSSKTADTEASRGASTGTTPNTGSTRQGTSQGTSPSTSKSSDQSTAQNQTAQSKASSPETAVTVSSSGKLDTSDIFTDRDLKQNADISTASTITVADGKTISITQAGVYVIKGTASNCTIRVETDKESKVQLVLDGVSITNTGFPAIYVVSADKCFITTTSSTNKLSVTGSFTSDGTTNTDAVVFSKDDIVLNGTGTLTIVSSQGNGITSKDDLKITGGTYNITSAKDSIEANDSISVYNGSININSSKDGLHSENDDDNSVGWIYIYGGNINITASSDAVQATTIAQIDGGTLTLKGSECIEATYVQINDGTVNIIASDDGINASQKSNYSIPTVEINGGKITIVMGQGDTDAIDANGNIIVNGGYIDITAQMSSFDYDGTAAYNGGTIIINGTQVNSIPQSMMGGGMGGVNGMNRTYSGFGGRNRW